MTLLFVPFWLIVPSFFMSFCRSAPTKMGHLALQQQQMYDAVGPEFVEVRQLLDEIKISALKKHGLFSDQDPTRSRARQIIRDRVTINDGTEASVNRAVADDLFENDILLTVPQAKQILQEIKDAPSNRRRAGRQANPSPSSLWEAVTIPYMFQLSQTDSNWQNNVRNGQRHIESLTCIRFTFHHNDYSLRGKDYLQYFRGTGCWSQVGKTGGRQPISIGYGCESLGIVAHETLHALGLWHEQSRLDRDNHIRINYDAILPGTESNFEKRTPDSSDNMGQPYDLGSAMHYGNKAFSSDSRSYTILTMDKSYQQTIGQRGGLSFKDAKMINMRYCSDICKQKLDCDNDGYTDPLNCRQCRCPDGYSGDYCQSIPTSNTATCLNPGEFTAGEWPATMKTSALVSRASCYWRIHPLHSAQRVMLNFETLDFPCKDACNSYLEVKFRKDKIPTGARLCCGVPTTIYGDIGTDVLLILRAESRLDSTYQGFELSFTSVGDTPTVRPTTTPVTTTTATTTKPETTTTPKTTTTITTTKSTTTTTTTSKTTTTPKTTTTISTTKTTPTTTPTTSELTTETTEEPTTTTTEEEGIWSKWGGWSGCSATCGACGQRKRVRACYRGKCKGDSYQIERCAFAVCPTTTKPRPNRCNGRLVMPCELMQRLEFGTVIKYDGIRQQADNDSLDGQSAPMLDSNILIEEQRMDVPAPPSDEPHKLPPLLLTENNAEILRRNRRQIERRHSNLDIAQMPRIYCEKRFTYNCPTALLTISMDWRATNDDGENGTVSDSVMGEDRQCCAGHSPVDGQCVRNEKVRK